MEFHHHDNTVSTVIVHWAAPSGERTGQKVFSGGVQVRDRAKHYETRLLNLGFYTACIEEDNNDPLYAS